MNLAIEWFEGIVERAKSMAVAEREHQDDKPCLDCYLPSWPDCKEVCSCYQEWLQGGQG